MTEEGCILRSQPGMKRVVNPALAEGKTIGESNVFSSLLLENTLYSKKNADKWLDKNSTGGHQGWSLALHSLPICPLPMKSWKLVRFVV